MESVISLENYETVVKMYVEKYALSNVDVERVINGVRAGLAPNMDSAALAQFCAEVSASMITQHEEYGRLAAVVLMAHHHTITSTLFSEKIEILQRYNKNLNQELYGLVMANRAEYDAIPDYEKDFSLSYFSISSLLRSYLLSVGNKIIERPQDMYMRVAVQICRGDIEGVRETYRLLSDGFYTHSTPTLFNAMLLKCQLASCFLLSPKGDDVKGIFDTIGQCALISKHAGGIGINLHDIRCKGSALESTGGVSKGILPIMRIVGESMLYVNQGGIKRNSSAAFYIEPWHKDVFTFLDARKNTGPEEMRARSIFTAMWVPDLFMERVENNEDWSLFDPKEAPGLHRLWGDAFRKLYLRYEKTVSRTVVPAQQLWKAIVVAQIETGTPYMVYKDTCNRLSNQNHLGTIRNSNLCAEIVEYCDSDQTAVCNLSSVCLPRFVRGGMFDFHGLRAVVRRIVQNLNYAIDTSFYPTEECRFSNLRHRPIGIGVQGLADTFIKLRMPYESDRARNLNKLIFETMYFAALEASVELARVHGAHESFPGSMLSKGIFHFEAAGAQVSGLWDWESLRANIMQYGTRNSLFIALMPTAGTSQLCGNTECFEPITSNIFTRRTIAGEFQVVNSALVEDLIKLGMWSNEMRNLIIEYEGSIRQIPLIPQEIKDLYKTVWEIKMKSVLDLAADRQPFVDQSQSLNIFIQQPTYQKVSSMHFYGWKRGLKTGMYYLRSRPISSAIKFTVDQELVARTLSSLQDYSNTREDPENEGNVCKSCSC